MNQDVAVVTRRPEKLLESPSAVQVITGEDIRVDGGLLASLAVVLPD